MILPAAAPTIMTGMRISIGIAWLVIVAAEMLVGGTGIGYFVWNEWNNLSIANIIIAILLIGLVGMLLDQGAGAAYQARDLSGIDADGTSASISVEGLARRFGDGAPAGGVRGHLVRHRAQGEFVCLIGHSGCGKTTILNVLAGLDQPSDGAVIVDNREIDGPEPRSRRGLPGPCAAALAAVHGQHRLRRVLALADVEPRRGATTTRASSSSWSG